MQQNIKECLITLTTIRHQERRSKQMHRQVFKQHSGSFSYLISHTGIWIIARFIQSKKGHFAPFNVVVEIINLALYLYVKLKTFSFKIGNQATLAQTSFKSQWSQLFRVNVRQHCKYKDIAIWDCSKHNNLFCWLSMAYSTWNTDRIYSPTPNKTQYIWYFTRRKRFPVYMIA